MRTFIFEVVWIVIAIGLLAAFFSESTAQVITWIATLTFGTCIFTWRDLDPPTLRNQVIAGVGGLSYFVAVGGSYIVFGWWGPPLFAPGLWIVFFPLRILGPSGRQQ